MDFFETMLQQKLANGSGGGGSGLVVNVNKEGGFNICDATWNTIRNAIANGASVYFKSSNSFYDDEYYIAMGCTSYAQSSEYRVYYYMPTLQMYGSYTAASEDDYPKVDLD